MKPLVRFYRIESSLKSRYWELFDATFEEEEHHCFCCSCCLMKAHELDRCFHQSQGRNEEKRNENEESLKMSHPSMVDAQGNMWCTRRKSRKKINFFSFFYFNPERRECNTLLASCNQYFVFITIFKSLSLSISLGLKSCANVNESLSDGLALKLDHSRRHISAKVSGPWIKWEHDSKQIKKWSSNSRTTQWECRSSRWCDRASRQWWQPRFPWADLEFWVRKNFYLSINSSYQPRRSPKWCGGIGR